MWIRFVGALSLVAAAWVISPWFDPPVLATAPLWKLLSAAYWARLVFALLLCLLAWVSFSVTSRARKFRFVPWYWRDWSQRR